MKVQVPLNDENLDINRAGRLGRDAAAAGAIAAPAEPASPDIEYVLSEHLKALDDAETYLSTLTARLDSKEWLTVLEALNHARQLSLFHAAVMRGSLGEVVALVNKAMKNPRSALCKTAIMASADLFSGYQDEMLEFLEPLLLQLLLKASQDKRFVCEEAEKSLVAMTAWLSPITLLQKLQPYAAHKNPRVRAKASMCVYKCVTRLGVDGMKDYGWKPLLQMGASQLNDQLPEAREAARKLVTDLHAAYRQELQDQEQAQWEELCLTNLNTTTAQAVIRVTSS